MEVQVYHPDDEFGPYIEVPLHSRKYPGLVAKISPEDYELVSGYRWYPLVTPTNVYARTGPWQEPKNVKLHRLILDFPDYGVDHQNGYGLDNRHLNLREATCAQNAKNRATPIDNTSGFKGVCHYRFGRWSASIMVDGTRHYIGQYVDKTRAALAYDNAARKYHGAFARLNFPDVTEYPDLTPDESLLLHNNTSGYRGVTWNKTVGKWQAQISINSKNTFLGYSDDPVEAATIRDSAAIEYHGELARLNFPREDYELVTLWPSLNMGTHIR